MKIINIKDLNRKILYLNGGEYLINGKRYSFSDYMNNKIEIEELKELRKINITTVIINYYDELNQKEVSVKEYESLKEKLSSKGYYDEDGYIYFNELDDEYNYKKFIKNHKAVYKTIETVSENIEPSEELVVYKTDNEYIESCYFSEKEDEPLLYKYNREKAYLDIVKNTFDSLGFEFAGDCNFKATKDKKIWGNSNHSCIKYVTAFGTYIFDDSFRLYNSVIRGTLEDMKAQYEKDKARIEEVITRNYNENFSTLNRDKLNTLPSLINDLEYRLKKVDPYKKSWTDYRICKEKIGEIQKVISESFN